MYRQTKPKKHLEIANYPPPYDGWGMNTQFIVEEIRRRGHICKILKINENRQIKSAAYVDVQNGFDYLFKVIRFTASGYDVNMHVNAESPKGYLLALIAVSVFRLFLRKTTVTFHGGLPQSFFPLPKLSLWHWKFKLLFALATGIICNSQYIKGQIERYGVQSSKIFAAAGFTTRNLIHQKVPLNVDTEIFLQSHYPVMFCYVSFRPEYRLSVLREGMQLFRNKYPQAGFIWLGFPEKEMPAASNYVSTFSPGEKESLHLLGNLSHDEFITLLLRCTAKLRTAGCDGVSASILESLALGIPVIASENGRRPPAVISYAEMDAEDMCRQLEYVVQNLDAIKQQTRIPDQQDNIVLTVNWLLS